MSFQGGWDFTSKIFIFKNRLPENPSSASPRFLTSSACGRGILIGPLTVNHHQFGVMQRRSRSVRQNNVGEAIERALDFLKSKDRNVVLKPEQRQAVSTLQKGEDVLAVLLTGFAKSMIFMVFGIAERESGRSS